MRLRRGLFRRLAQRQLPALAARHARSAQIGGKLVGQFRVHIVQIAHVRSSFNFIRAALSRRIFRDDGRARVGALPVVLLFILFNGGATAKQSSARPGRFVPVLVVFVPVVLFLGGATAKQPAAGPGRFVPVLVILVVFFFVVHILRGLILVNGHNEQPQEFLEAAHPLRPLVLVRFVRVVAVISVLCDFIVPDGRDRRGLRPPHGGLLKHVLDAHVLGINRLRRVPSQLRRKGSGLWRKTGFRVLRGVRRHGRVLFRPIRVLIRQVRVVICVFVLILVFRRAAAAKAPADAALHALEHAEKRSEGIDGVRVLLLFPGVRVLRRVPILIRGEILHGKARAFGGDGVVPVYGLVRDIGSRAGCGIRGVGHGRSGVFNGPFSSLRRVLRPGCNRVQGRLGSGLGLRLGLALAVLIGLVPAAQLVEIQGGLHIPFVTHSVTASHPCPRTFLRA